MNSDKIAKIIKKARLMKGLTQQQLADKTMLSKATIGMVERGEVNLSINNIDAIFTALKIKVAFTIK